ncbi:MAG: PAS domain S-box protein [Anaerolineales bacterium]|nr:PAS domain S-box protein [Anaerolineales bacterium]
MTKKKATSVKPIRRKSAPQIRPQKSEKLKNRTPPPPGVLWEDDRVFRVLLKNSNDIFTFLDAGGKILYRSPTARRVIQLPEEKVVQSSFQDWIWPDDLPGIKSLFEKVFSFPGKTIPFQTRIKDESGAPRWIEGILVNHLADPAIGALLVNYRDITDRKRQEQALRDSMETFRSIFDNSSAGVAIVGLDRRYRMVNPAYCEIFGYTQEEFLRTDFLDLTHPDDVERSRQLMQDVLDGKGRNIRFSKRYIHKDGHTIWAEGSSTLVLGTDGKPSHILTNILDVTDRRRAEEALLESELKAGAMMAAAPYGITFVDATGAITYANPAAEQILGLRRSDITGRTYDDPRWRIAAPDGSPIPPEQLAFARVRKSRQAVRDLEHTIQREDGKRVLLSINGSPLFGPDGSVAGMISILEDITERRRAEEALRESERRYRSLFESSLEGIGLSQGNKIIDANKALLEILGYENLAELRAVPLLDTIAPESREYIAQRMREATEAGSKHFVFKALRKNGEARDLELSTDHIVIENELFTLSTFRDITDKKRAEEELRALAQRHGALLEAIPEIVMEVDTCKIYTWANPAGLEFFGEDVVGREAASYFEGEQQTYNSVKPLFNGVEDTIYLESWQRRVDGEKRLLAWWCRNLKNSAGEVTGAISSARDITEQNLAREQIQSLSRFPTENPNPVMRITPEGGLVYANQASQPFLEMWKVGVGQTVPEEIRAILGDVYITNANREIDIPCRDRVFTCTLTPIQSAGYVNVYGRDITERKQVEEKLRESEELYRTLIELSPDPIFIHTEGVVSYANSAGLTLLGAEHPGQILGKKVLDLIHPDDREDVARRYWEGVRDNKIIPLSEEKYLRLDGSYVDVEAMGKPLRLQGKTCAQVVMRDITERKRSEEALARQTEELRQRNADLARLNALTERRMQRLAAMRAIDTAITSSFKLELVLNILLGQLTDLLGAHAADILIFFPDLQTFRFASGRGFRNPMPEQTFIRKAASYANQAAQERRTIKVARLEEKTDGAKMYSKTAGEDFSAYWCMPLMAKGLVKGVLEIFHRAPLDLSPEEETFLEMVAGQAAIAIDNAELFEGLQASNDELTLAYTDTLTGWARTLELRNRETTGEAQRLAENTVRLARSHGASESELVFMYRGAILHDIGMMGIPDSILQKPGLLTDEERAVMRKHPQYAYDLLSSINYLRSAIDIPFCHHERFDGSGYPRGLKGDQIPLAARIFAVVDVWDALRSRRAYRAAWTDAEARDYIRQNSGTLFDPKTVQTFLEVISGL